jgi:uncharacterized protein
MFTKPTYICKSVEVKGTGIKGDGLFAKKEIPKKTIVFRWGGTFVNGEELKKFSPEEYVIIQVDDNLWSIEARKSPEEETYYINHSCDPNVWMKDAVTFMARRNIKKGEELTTDYSLFEKESWSAKWECKCGTNLCRHHITEKDYLLPELQKRYANHFSPVILKKIKKFKE